MKHSIAALLMMSLLLAGCRQNRNSEPRDGVPVPVNYAISEKSPLFSQDHITLAVDTAANYLFITMGLHPGRTFPFPVHPKYHDTLHKTAFRFSFMAEGKEILSDYCSLRNTARYVKDTINKCALMICTDTSDLRFCGQVVLKIPFYAFHHLKTGRHTIDLVISQDIFTDDVALANASGSTNYYHASVPAKLLQASVRFQLNIPPIYRSLIMGYGIRLKNDSSFNPAGMDNTVWKSSYPDIYWSIYYPKNQFYAQTDYQTSTSVYTGFDTFSLYHYYDNDSIGFAVYDHDNLSRDDGLGYWWGDQGFLEKQPVRRLTFGNVAAFDIGIKKEGIVNP